jgi:D-amino peptidase
MKFILMTDLEGVAGVTSFADQTHAHSPYYLAARKLLTAEVNAAVEGLLKAGVEDILVIDGHGAGGISFEDLHPAARLLHGRPLAPWSRLIPIYRQYDACGIVGQHAMAGVITGNMNHTQSSESIDYYMLNDRKIGEIAQMALFAGALGVPMIFLSGEEDACREAEALIPGITTAAVKQGLGRGSAISLSAPEAQRRIQQGILQAVECQHREPIPPLCWDGPYTLEIRYFHTDAADASAARPGFERVDSQTVRIRSDSVVDIIYL